MKPRAPITVPVTARVSPERKQWLLDGALQHQMSLCEYAALTLELAGGQLTELDVLRRQNAVLQARLDEANERLHTQQAKFTWYTGSVQQQLQYVLRNRDCLQQLYAQYHHQPISVAVAREKGFDPAYLLTTSASEGARYFVLGDYGWRYSSLQQTHLLLAYYGNRPD
jgi:hypothetical protein